MSDYTQSFVGFATGRRDKTTNRVKMLSKWDYIRSAVILVASLFFVQHVFELHIVEGVALVVLVIVAVVHTMDVRDDVLKKLEIHRQKKEDKRKRENDDLNGGW